MVLLTYYSSRGLTLALVAIEETPIQVVQKDLSGFRMRCHLELTGIGLVSISLPLLLFAALLKKFFI